MLMHRARERRDRRLRAAVAAHRPQRFVDTYEAPAVSAPIIGRASRVMLNSGEAVPVCYAVVEADWLITSHRGLTYRRDERYPAAAQPRNYGAERELQLAVESRACNLDPLRLLSDSVLSVDGPPIVRADGVVLSGNGRTQSIRMAVDRGLYSDVREGVLERASWFRLDEQAIIALRAPVLVRIMTEDVADARELARLGLEMNRDPGQGMSSTEQSIALARLVTPAVVNRLTELIAELPGDKSVREFMRIRGRDIAVILGHSDLIDSRKRSMYFTEAGELTEAAKQMIETALAGLTVNDIDVLRAIEPWIAWLGQGLSSRERALLARSGISPGSMTRLFGSSLKPRTMLFAFAL